MNSNLTETANESAQSAHRVLTLLDCIGIIVGTIIGAGIFAIPAVVASKLPNVTWLFIVWTIGGGVALIGAMCFAELTTSYPDRGGDYGYLKRAFHRHVGFAFSWAAFWVIRPGNIGAMAMIFGKFAVQAFPAANGFAALGWAMFSVALMTATNLLGVTFGKTTQNFLTLAKVVGILIVVAAALWLDPTVTDNAAAVSISASESAHATASFPSWGSFWLAMVFVMFTFGGWNDIAFVASEVRQPEKNLLRSLIFGTVCVLLIYLLVNLALVSGLSFAEMATLGQNFSDPTSTLVGREFGARGSQLLAVLVCVSCLGAINAMIFTSPRIYWATALDYPALSWLTGSQRDHNGWWRAMLLQGIGTIGMVWLFGRQQQGIENIVAATAPYFWLFLGLTVLGLIVCRERYRNRSNEFSGFRVPLYPALPIVFIVACVLMMGQAWQYSFAQKLSFSSLAIGGWVMIGVGLSFVLAPKPNSPD